MTDQTGVLPSGFEALESFVERWALTSSSERTAKRVQSSDDERHTFYEVGKAPAEEALAFLDKKAMSDLDDGEEHLMNLMLSLAHVSLAVEVRKVPSLGIDKLSYTCNISKHRVINNVNRYPLTS